MRPCSIGYTLRSFVELAVLVCACTLSALFGPVDLRYVRTVGARDLPERHCARAAVSEQPHRAEPGYHAVPRRRAWALSVPRRSRLFVRWTAVYTTLHARAQRNRSRWPQWYGVIGARVACWYAAIHALAGVCVVRVADLLYGISTACVLLRARLAQLICIRHDIVVQLRDPFQRIRQLTGSVEPNQRADYWRMGGADFRLGPASSEFPNDAVLVRLLPRHVPEVPAVSAVQVLSQPARQTLGLPRVLWDAVSCR